MAALFTFRRHVGLSLCSLLIFVFVPIGHGLKTSWQVSGHSRSSLSLPPRAGADLPEAAIAGARDDSDTAMGDLSRRTAIATTVSSGAAVLGGAVGLPHCAAALGEEVELPSGLKYIDLAFGPPQQPMPKPGSTVKIDFEGWTGGYDGERFTKGTTEARLDSGMLIAGIDEALHTMNIGSKRRLEIKPELAYGATGFPKAGDDAGTVVPPNTKIFFEIRLRSIKASPF